ncbi:unnamed protein product [Rotaria magnacalcarata]|uniref:Uncharacterized protein n=1 Tax=Rotaria magnacalcarata TaxID=392030 RepID=A0A816RYX5_9BILA|nr:unnamed protein product [Rotaria magnacalcarata]
MHAAWVSFYTMILNYQIAFFTNGSEYNSFNINIITDMAIQSVSLDYVSSPNIKYWIQVVGFTDNECEWNYAREIINRFTNVDYQPLQNALTPLLYNSEGNSVLQCYADIIPVNYSFGICVSNEMDAVSLDRFCNSYSPTSSIDIYRFRGFSSSSSMDGEAISFVCNRNLCNSPSTENEIKQIIGNYAHLLNIIPPKNSR